MTGELYHHGIRGQKWGERHGPPYPLKGRQYSRDEKRKKYKKRLNPNSTYSNKHFDKTISKGTDLSTLSYDKDRTKNTDMFYATYTETDKHKYRTVFNKKMKTKLFDEKGNEIGTGEFYKYQIKNTAKSDIKVASEDAGIKVFEKLFEENRDFSNFVTDPERMEKQMLANRYGFKSYREAKKVLTKMENPEYQVTSKDLSTIYKMFNCVIPADGMGDAKAGKDVATQRAKFFKELKSEGYGAVLDTNDSIYGGYHAQAPVIVFDMEQIVPSDVKRLKLSDKAFSILVYHGRKTLGI